MKNSSLRIFFRIYTLALVFCSAARTWLKFTSADLETGFYLGGGRLPSLYMIILAGTIALLFLLYLLRSTDADYPILLMNRPLSLLALLVGTSILLYQFELLQVFSFSTTNPGISLTPLARISCVILGQLAALAFLIIALRGLTQDSVNGVLALIAGVWQMILVVNKFNGYKTLTAVTDNTLAVLFMLFCTMFMVGHARTLGGLARKDGRNYAIPTGLCASLLGFMLVIPNWIYMAVNRTVLIPAPLLGGWESIFIAIMSLYALAFVRHTCDCIKSV